MHQFNANARNMGSYWCKDVFYCLSHHLIFKDLLLFLVDGIYFAPFCQPTLAPFVNSD